MIKRSKFLAIYVLAVAILSVMMVGFGAWVVAPSDQSDPSHSIPADSSPCFTTDGGYYTGTAKRPVLNDLGVAIYGDGVISAYVDLTEDEGIVGLAPGYKAECVAAFDVAGRELPEDKWGINAGKHYYKITDLSTGQVISNYHELEISKAPAVIIGSTVADSKGRTRFYDGETITTLTGSVQLIAPGDGYTDEDYKDHPLLDVIIEGLSFTGSFTYGASYTKQSKNATIAVGQTGYSSTSSAFSNVYIVEQSVTSSSVSVEAVAYKGSTYYGTVESAISENSSSKATVYVIPYSESESYNDYSHSKAARTIKGTVTITSTLTLVLPYSGTDYNKTEEARDKKDGEASADYNDFVKSTYLINAYSDPESFLKNELFVTGSLTVEGTLNIGGFCYAGGGGQFAGHTHGSYAQLTIDGGSMTVASNANFNCYGFVKNTGSYEKLVFESGSNMSVPFVLYEFRGGSVSTAMQNPDDKTFYSTPFIRFNFPNIVGEYRINGGTTTKARAALAAAGQSATADTAVIGTGTDSLIQLPVGSRVDIKYVHDTTVDGTFGKLSLKFYGDATLNSLYIYKSFNFVIAKYEVEVSSRGAYMPISYVLDIEIASGTFSAISSSGSVQNIKVLPGGKITVAEGATLKAANIIVYDTSPEKGPAGYFDYPAVGTKGIEAGKLVVAGTLEAEGVAGEITPAGANARLKIKSGVKINDSWEAYTKYETNSQSIITPPAGFPTDYKTNPGAYSGLYKTSTAGPVDLVITTAGSDTLVYYYNYIREAKGSVINGVGSSAQSNLKATEYSAVMLSENVYAWLDPTVTVTLNPVGGSVTPSSMRFTAHLGESGIGLTMAEYASIVGVIPTRADSEFLGWYLDEAYEKPLGEYYTEIVSDVTLYAKWTLNQLTTVTFNTGGGSTVAPITVTVTNDGISEEDLLRITSAVSSKVGYESWGWFIDEGCTQPVSRTNIKNKSVTVYMKWIELTGTTYTVTYDPNNAGKVGIEDVDYSAEFGQASVAEGVTNYRPIYKTASTDTNPLIMYYLVGWSTEPDATEATPSFEITSNVTLYAVWAEKEHTVTYSSDGTNGGLIQYYCDGQGLVPATSERVSYKLAGWYTAASDGEKRSEGYSVTEDMTLYAVWRGVMVYYDANGGSVTTGSEQYNGSPMTLPTPTRTGYKFTGWYTAASGGDKVGDAGGGYTPTDGITLYAQWTGFTVTFDANDGSVSPGSAQYNGTAITLPTPTRSGYTFNGWYTASSGGSKVGGAGDPYTPAADVTLYAQWTKESSGGGGCVADGTLITLADGTVKPVEEILESDILLVFDHETGQLIAAPIIFVERDGWKYYNVINLVFSDGTHLRLIYEHAIFDINENKYVYITEENYLDYVGHEFASFDGSGIGTVTLDAAYVTSEYAGCFSLVTAYHLNYFIDGMLSIPGGITGLFNYFEYGDGLVYDKEKMEADIEEYGLYTYEDFSDYLPEEVYEMFAAPYFKISVGKGYVSFDEILSMIETYLIKNGVVPP